MLITLLRRVAGPPGGVPSTTIQEPRGVTIAFPRRVALLSCVLGLPLGTACTPGETEPPFDMATYLEDAAANVDPAENRFANSALLRAMEVLPPRTNDRERLLLRLAIAEQTLYAGRLEAAIGLLESLRADVADHQASAPESERAPPSFLESLLDFLATAYLRLGERENCIDGVGAVACLVPVPAEGVHTAPRGARASIPIFEELLERNPDNLGARWMLNVAHMMLGTYPTDVPSELLIPELAFRSEHDIGRFRDVAPALGVDDVGHVGGGIMDDFNGDGLLDLMASSWQLRDPLSYHLNRGDGTFERLTGAAGLEGLWGGGNIVQADYDNDGDLDVFVLRGGWLVEGQVNSLLRNRGDGTFEDVTEQAGLLRPAHPSQTASWADFDGDGLLDLFVGNETFGGRSHPCQLFRNLGDGTFVDVAPEAGVAITGIVKGVTWGDYDNDGRPDLYVSRTNAPNLLLRNEGRGADGAWSFSDRTAEAGVAEPWDAFPTWFWDYDNDGWLDIFVAGYRTNFGDIAAEYLNLPHDSELPRLYRNRGDGTFDEVSEAVGLDRIQFSMGSNYGDLDNDGWLDFYVGTGDAYFQALMPNRMFRSDRGEHFQDVTTSGGFGLIEKGHGIAFGDIDHDGDQDVFVAMGGAYEGDLAHNVLFENPGHGNRWLSLWLEGVESNRSAIGARVRVTIEVNGRERNIHRVVSSGSTFGGNPLRLDIGLGRAERVRSVTVHWPTTGRTQELGPLETDSAYRVREGVDGPELLERNAFVLGEGG